MKTLSGDGETVDANRIELALGAAHHAVVNHDEIGVGLDHIASVQYGGIRWRALEFFQQLLSP